MTDREAAIICVLLALSIIVSLWSFGALQPVLQYVFQDWQNAAASRGVLP